MQEPPAETLEQAQHIESWIKTRPSVVLNEQDQEKERTSDGSAEQQQSGK
jgi:hypothetical protein